MVSSANLLVGSDIAFGVFFGAFVLALLVLAFVAVRWGVRRDRPGREAWKQRHFQAGQTGGFRSGRMTGRPDTGGDTRQ